MSDTLTRLKQHLAHARAIHDEFDGKSMPAEAARQMSGHLDRAAGLRRKLDLENHERWLGEPVYRHSMTGEGECDIDGNPYSGKSQQLSAKTISNFAAFVRGSHKAALVEDQHGNKLVPSDFAGTVVQDLSREGVIRGRAFVRPTSRRSVDVGVVNVASASWGKLELGDSASDGLGDPPADDLTVVVHDLNAIVKIGRDELEDSDEGLVDLIRQAVVAKLAEQEDDAFAAGAGDAQKMPLGIAKDTTITQGVTAAAAGTVTADDLRRLVYAVPAWARRQGAYYGSSTAEQAAALLKDATDNYIWKAPDLKGSPATFDGRPWFTVDGLPAVGGGDGETASRALAFGDMHSAYLIADRRKFTVDVLREAFLADGKIGLLFTHRVGGRTIRPRALAFLNV